MRAFAFQTCRETQVLCDAIVDEMMRLFGIPEAEAVGRVNRQWGRLDLRDPQDIIQHEDEVYWAKTIYYGKDSSWWLDEASAKPRPFP